MLNKLAGALVSALALLLCTCSRTDAAQNELTKAEQAAGWKLLFDGRTTEGWRSFKKQNFPDQRWAIEDGWLHCLGKGGGEIISANDFDDFELAWEWKQAPGGNSGVKYFVSETRESAVGHEYQLIDEEREPDAKQAKGKRVTAAFYDVLKPTAAARPNPPGEVNRSRVVVKGNHVEHWLNDSKVLEYECGSPELKAALAESKFKSRPDFGQKLRGHVLLQDHHSEVWFRNVKLRPL